MVYSFLNKLCNYEKWDNYDEEEQENLTQSCSDDENNSEEVSVSIGTSKESKAGTMNCKLRPTPNGRIYFFRPSLLNFIFLLIFIFLVYHWIFSKLDKIHNLRRTPIEDAFNRRISLFMSYQGRNLNFTVFKRRALEGRVGDFSCSSSIHPSKCAFHVDNLIQAIQICKVYDDVCKGFVLTEEKGGLVIYLKHDVARVHKSNDSALFVRTCFVPKEGFELMTNLDLT
ncbi:uncharacterized protein LOC116293225 [Actinia tenebrosa]|uniref:Uncharacterized protein LOC116293225 n=1 Tax=Actinia tenebrosa TaxID=6105 RepID=A0A6P8HUY8_ACTTE|nr:uncharacterized protein LOC116293225 [Actinia tenebrosa]